MHRLYLAHLLEVVEWTRVLCASTLASFKLMSLTLIIRRGESRVAYAVGLWEYNSGTSACTVLRTSIEWQQDFTLTNL